MCEYFCSSCNWNLNMQTVFVTVTLKEVIHRDTLFTDNYVIIIFKINVPCRPIKKPQKYAPSATLQENKATSHYPGHSWRNVSVCYCSLIWAVFGTDSKALGAKGHKTTLKLLCCRAHCVPGKKGGARERARSFKSSLWNRFSCCTWTVHVRRIHLARATFCGGAIFCICRLLLPVSLSRINYYVA